MKKSILIIATLAILCFGSLAFGQNSNSSTTMAPNTGNGNMMMGRRGRHHRRHHRRHRRGRAGGSVNKNG